MSRRLLLAALLLAAPAAAQSDLRTTLAGYAHRVQLLEDQDAIENLQASFGYYFDKGLWDQAAALFSARGSFEYGQRGVYVGQERVRRAMLMYGPQGPAAGHLNNHMQLQAVIVVAPDGRTATGRWQGMVMLGRAGDNGIWGVGVYENEYVKEGRAWRIAKLHFYPTMFTDYDLGPAKSAYRMEGPSALFPPDRPPTYVYRAFPGNFVPPFGYRHPVTGKPIEPLPQSPDSVLGQQPGTPPPAAPPANPQFERARPQTGVQR